MYFCVVTGFMSNWKTAAVIASVLEYYQSNHNCFKKISIYLLSILLIQDVQVSAN